MTDPIRHFDNLICIADFVPMSDERKEMLRQAASELARLRLTDAEREAVEWYAAYGAGDHAATLRALLARLSPPAT